MKFERSHIIIAIIGIVACYIIYLIVNKKKEGMEEVKEPSDVNTLMTQLTEEENKQQPIAPEEQDIDGETKDKLHWKNEAPTNKYVKSSYAEGERGNTQDSELDDFWKVNSNQVDDSYVNSNDGFRPVDESHGNLAEYAGKGQKKMKPDELFKVDELLPQEVNKQWFEVMPEPIKVKNRHLINITQPIGINTIGTSLKNPSYDIRGDKPCPKFVVGPWLQSTIEPDTNTKGLC